MHCLSVDIGWHDFEILWSPLFPQARTYMELPFFGRYRVDPWSHVEARFCDCDIPFWMCIKQSFEKSGCCTQLLKQRHCLPWSWSNTFSQEWGMSIRGKAVCYQWNLADMPRYVRQLWLSKCHLEACVDSSFSHRRLEWVSMDTQTKTVEKWCVNLSCCAQTNRTWIKRSLKIWYPCIDPIYFATLDVLVGHGIYAAIAKRIAISWSVWLTIH